MIPVFDGHNDALTRPDHADLVAGRAGGHLDLPRMQAGSIRGAIFAVFTPTPGERMDTLPRADGVIEAEYAASVPHADAAAFSTAAAGRLAALEAAGHLRLARVPSDLDAARVAGPPAAVLSLEGAEAIDPACEALDHWHAAGLRALGITWSRANAFGHGVPFLSPSSPDTGPGLTPAGHRLVRRCGELGILVDVSHLNQAGFWDVARLEAGPVVASHSGAHAIAPMSRNLTDEQLREVGRTGGLVGIVFACDFLRPDFREDPDTPLSLIAQHAAHVAEVAGTAGVALGSDFDGCTIPAGVGDAAGMPRVLNALREAGFSAAEVEQVAWGNWRRVLGACWRG